MTLRTARPSRTIRLASACLAAAAFAVTASSQQGTRPPAPQPPTTFRTAANFVQVDVYPTSGGKPVADLAVSDFEVLEDGVAQSIASFEHVSARPASIDAAPRDPRSTAEEKALVADPHNRLFVIFLDSYHVTDWTAWHNGKLRRPGSMAAGRPREQKPLGPLPIDKAIVTFLEKFIGPNDMVAAMSPEMDASGMVFGRRPERFADWVSTAWARRFSWDDMDPEEERWNVCYPSDAFADQFGCFTGIWEEMVLRRHEMLTLRALQDTVNRLGDLREGRKAVLLVSEGWPSYRPNQQLARPLPPYSIQGCPVSAPATKGIFVGPSGKLQSGSDPRNPQTVDRHDCDASRLQLSLLDNESEYRRLLDRANRETVSFYPIDPRGLAVFDTPIDAVSPTGQSSGGVNDDYARLRGRLESLRNLASATDGFVSESNDFNASMKRIADDLSEYYLLGYNSTNTAFDGKFRTISVRVKRSGVQVRARRGYRAPTEAELRTTPAAATVDPATRLREAALTSLGTMPSDLPLRVSGGTDWAAGRASLWTIIELGDAAARLPEWRDGGEAQVSLATATGTVVASGAQRLSSAARSFLWRPEAGLEAGEYLVRVSARPAVAGAAGLGGQVKITLPAGNDAGTVRLGTPRLLRRGPATGLSFSATADERFRRTERVRLEVSVSGPAAAIAARLLDRRGQALPVPVAASMREEQGTRLATAEAALAALAPGDYLLELSVGEGASTQVTVTALRIVP
jgi:VWFA-related protein